MIKSSFPTKTCRKCQTIKPIHEFDIRTDTGKPRAQCHECRLAKRRLRKNIENTKNQERYWHTHTHKVRTKQTPEEIAEKRKRYYLANKESFNRKRREYYLSHKEQETTKNKEYREKNPELVKQRQSIYQQVNKERLRIKQRVNKKKREEASISYRLRNRIRARLSYAINQALATKDDVSANLTGCSIQELMNHIETKFYNGMTWSDYGKGHDCFQIDHIKPCCSFNLTDPVQQRECFHYTNLQPLWFNDHMKKTQQDIVNCKRSVL